jgi:type IV secretion system protein VirB10
MASITIGASCSRPRPSPLLSVGAESGSSSGESDIVRALRNGASNSISQTGQQIVQRQLNIAPTLTIRRASPSA